MYPLIQFKTTTLLLLVAFALACFALSPRVQAVSPAPDGGYPGQNTAEGDMALFFLTTGIFNTAVGSHALFHDTTGSHNTATGDFALAINTTGDNNTATGDHALFLNQAGGIDNTADGFEALRNNTTGDGNTATGSLALGSNQDGRLNTANGFEALRTNQHGSENTATGDTALFANTADGNTADGSGALHDNTTGNGNTATGDTALFFNTTGSNNTATGFQALTQNIQGVDNTADGFKALENNTTGVDNTASGELALSSNTTGSNNIALGRGAGFNLTTGSCNIDIGNNGGAGESNTIRIGSVTFRERGCGQTATFIAGIRGVTTGNMDAVAVVIDSAGQLGTVSSSQRFKKEIKPMNESSEAILGLKPVTFQYKSDSKGTPQFGLIAEEVEKVNPDLVVRNADGEIYTVRYDAINAMLLNEFLKEHRTVQGQQKEIDALKAELKEEKALIQKVSDQLEVSKPAPHVVGNGQ